MNIIFLFFSYFDIQQNINGTIISNKVCIHDTHVKFSIIYIDVEKFRVGRRAWTSFHRFFIPTTSMNISDLGT